MGVERDDLLVAGNGRPVVDQHAHAHAAIGGLQQLAGQQPPGLVAAKDEVLQIQRSLGGVDHLHPGQESVDADRDDAKSRGPVVLARGGREPAAETGLLWMRKRH